METDFSIEKWMRGGGFEIDWFETLKEAKDAFDFLKRRWDENLAWKISRMRLVENDIKTEEIKRVVDRWKAIPRRLRKGELKAIRNARKKEG